VDKPVLIYDGKCGFCKIWIEYWKTLTGDAVTYAPSQEVGSEYHQIPPEAFGKSVQLVMPSGEVLSGAHAVFETLASHPSWCRLLSAYYGVPGFARITEASYRFIAGHRNTFYWVTVLLFGRKVEPLRFEAVQTIFQKLLAATYLTAFVSFGVQARALIGSQGVEPVAIYFQRIGVLLGPGAWRAAPSLFWLHTSDVFIQAVWLCGAACSLLAIFDVFWRGALVVAFVCYLSLLNASQEFLSYQWDILLLEAGFLSLFLGYSRIVVWLFRWLLFRLMFLSGAVKLLSGDSTWHGLTALTVHFQTQPIPTPLAWYAHQLPVPFLKASCLLVLFVELIIPFLVLGPRRVRLFAAPWLIGLQVMIMLTGNYAFFNWLSLALCLFLFDDAHLERIVPGAWLGRISKAGPVRRRVVVALTCVIGLLSTLFSLQALRVQLPAAARALISAAAPFGITSSYGLFATMTTRRPEIVIEGSNDGAEWREYEFRYKPGRLDRRPPWVAPHQPRLDWQMWFAAFSSYQENVWFLNLLARLLQNNAEVLSQFEHNPFPDRAPRLIRASLYEYRFTDWQTRKDTHAWWTRTPLGPYVPPVALEDLSDLPLLKTGQLQSCGFSGGDVEPPRPAYASFTRRTFPFANVTNVTFPGGCP
jgi:predicted DCC family thiol-disulfide oxidoreductase YuxK